MTESVQLCERTSMEGMIWNANHVLSYALRPGIRGVPKAFFHESAGIVVMSVVDAGLIFSGAVGTGILSARQEDGTWSSPVACGLTGVGFGFVLGLQTKQVIAFLPDKASVQGLITKGVKLGGKSNLTVGVGRELEGSYGVSKSGVSDRLIFAYSKGAFVSLSLEGALVMPRNTINKSFYGSNVETSDIVEGKISFPTDKTTLWPDVLIKLDKLARGESELPGDSEKQRMEEAKVVANLAAEEARQADSEIVEVNAEAEAAKET